HAFHINMQHNNNNNNNCLFALLQNCQLSVKQVNPRQYVAEIPQMAGINCNENTRNPTISEGENQREFGAAFAIGVDIDSQAIASASENATLNNIIPDKLQLHLIASQTSSSCRDDWPSRVVEGENAFELDRVTHKDKYDVVIANILLNPLLNLADQIIFSAKPGVIIGLSGILSEHVQNLLQKYSLFLEGIEVSKMDDWACVSGRKKKNIDIC
ncbi:hypothetical protein S83_047999, partial [Arachis hypogaea]